MKLSIVVLLCAASVALAHPAAERSESFTAGFPVRSLVFSSEGSTNYVTLEPKKPLDLDSFTLCLRAATELPQLKRDIILFAYWKPTGQNNDLLNLWHEADGSIGLYLSSGKVKFPVSTLGPTQTHVCVTWESSSGATSVFMDGKKSVTKIYQKGHTVSGGGTVTIGQDSDGGVSTFEYSQSFVGEISDINLWSSVLPDSVIKQMATSGQTVQNGDVIDWSETTARVNGKVNIIHRQA